MQNHTVGTDAAAVPNAVREPTKVIIEGNVCHAGPPTLGRRIELAVQKFRLVEFDCSRSTFRCIFTLHLRWQDPAILADPEKYDLDKARLWYSDWRPPWQPLIEFLNDTEAPEVVRENFKVDAMGYVRCFRRIRGSFYERLNLRRFPYDRHILSVRIFSVGLSTDYYLAPFSIPYPNTLEPALLTGWKTDCQLRPLPGSDVSSLWLLDAYDAASASGSNDAATATALAGRCEPRHGHSANHVAPRDPNDGENRLGDRSYTCLPFCSARRPACDDALKRLPKDGVAPCGVGVAFESIPTDNPFYFHRAAVRVAVQRSIGFYHWNMAVPLFSLVLCAVVAFVIPPELFSDRLSVLVTFLLTLVAFKFVVAAELPRVGYNTILDYYVIVCFVMLCALILIAAVSFLLAHRVYAATDDGLSGSSLPSTSPTLGTSPGTSPSDAHVPANVPLSSPVASAADMHRHHTLVADPVVGGIIAVAWVVGHILVVVFSPSIWQRWEIIHAETSRSLFR
eukprot:TRINITY_DN21419_c0_g1_i1.p1 TRINITY_DN21419_c0_g1~~TRINITY_DN21419_c0_g1_i1.p1  ORF type:complete len:508 (-),score=59.10 TRINITY_DN21419_c0_g1_i1:90-1613(-)